MKNSFLLFVKVAILSTTFFFTSSSVSAQGPILSFTNFLTGLSAPVDMVHAYDGTNRLFIVQQGGIVRVYDGTLQTTPFLDLTSVVSQEGGEMGLLSIAFHPDYETNRYFFVFYNRPNNDNDIVIARYRTSANNPNVADPTSGVVLIVITKTFGNHNGGKLNFGPDGFLYFGTGDGGGSGDPDNNAQNGNVLLGKIIRINVNNFDTPPYYTVPANNPYINDPNVDDRIWAMGLRNPWRWSFDNETGDMWIADVGESAFEEVNFRTAGNTGGFNYGWRCIEGMQAFNTSGCAAQNSYTSPIFTYTHNSTTGGFSITGGYVYRGSEFHNLEGYYICADYVSGNVWLINPGASGWNVKMQAGLPKNISAFAEAQDGTLYAIALPGTIYKVNAAADAPLPVTLISFSATRSVGYNELKWKTASEADLLRFVIEYSMDGINFQTAGEVPANNNPNGNEYSYLHNIGEAGKVFYRLRIPETTGKESFSSIISIAKGSVSPVKIYPTVIIDNIIRINAGEPVTKMRLLDHTGRLVISKSWGRRDGYFTVSLPVLSNGVYYVQLEKESGPETFPIIIRQ